MPSTVPTKRRGLFRKLAFLAGGLFLLLVVGFFVVTSGAFLRGVILPKVGQAMNAEVTATDASLSPFSQIVLKGFKVQTTGTEPLVTAQEVRARYHLWDIIGGRIHVDEVALVSPVVNIIYNADDTSNLDPILKSPSSSGQKPATSPVPSVPPQIDIRKVALNNATVRLVKNHSGGGRDVTEVANLNIELADLKNGQTAKLTLAADLSVDNRPPAPGTNASLQARISAAYTFALSADLQPAALQGNSRFSVTKAGGAFAELAALDLALEADATPTEVKQLALRFQKAGADLGEVRVRGPFDLAKSEGVLQIEIPRLDRSVLNLAGASAGIDFGGTTVHSTNQITITKAGQVIAALGQLRFSQLSLTQKGATTPPVDLHLAYQTTVDLGQSSALLQTLILTGTQNGRPLLSTELTSPMPVAWGKATGTTAVGDAALNLIMTNLSLADWKAFTGQPDAAGLASATLKIRSQRGGQLLRFNLGAQLDNLSLKLASNSITQAAVSLSVAGEASGVQQISLTSFRVALARQGEEITSVFGGGQFDLEKKTTDVNVTLDAALSRLLALAPTPGLELSSGRASATLHVMQQAQTQSITGNLGLLELSGRKDGLKFENLAAGVVLDLALTNPTILDLRLCRLTLPATARVATNAAQLSGRIDFTQADALVGRLKLSADAFDATPYYDLVAGQTAPASKPDAPATVPAPAPAPGGDTEPAPMQLPLKDFTFEAEIHRFHLRELVVTNLLTTTRIQGSRVVMKPLQLALNGAPVSGEVDLNLGVPGYEYTVNFDATRIPLAPLADSFSPAYKGQAKGDILASFQIKGAGITGPSLQKNLSGGFAFAFTNADIQLAGPKAKRLITPIALVLGVTDLMKSPLSALATTGKMGGGKVQVTQCHLLSEAFTADTAGDVVLAHVLTNSTLQPQWPVHFALRRSLAEKARLVPRNAPTNTAYVGLPDFAKVGGTLGEPKTSTDKLALVSLLGQAATALPGGVGEKVGAALDKYGGFLNGDKARITNAPGTNAPAGQEPAKFNPLDLLKKPKK